MARLIEKSLTWNVCQQLVNGQPGWRDRSRVEVRTIEADAVPVLEADNRGLGRHRHALNYDRDACPALAMGS